MAILINDTNHITSCKDISVSLFLFSFRNSKNLKAFSAESLTESQEPHKDQKPVKDADKPENYSIYLV